MTEKKVTVPNRLGIHARPAALLVKAAAEYASDIHISFGGDRVNAKSIMGVMTLAACKGSELTIEADGPDEGEAVEALAAIVRDGFGEE
ncbi:MAG: HPr family phosphocarrier protein [Candidatus Fermentibacteraceae bacterium]